MDPNFREFSDLNGVDFGSLGSNPVGFDEAVVRDLLTKVWTDEDFRLAYQAEFRKFREAQPFKNSKLEGRIDGYFSYVPPRDPEFDAWVNDNVKKAGDKICELVCLGKRETWRGVEIVGYVNLFCCVFFGFEVSDLEVLRQEDLDFVRGISPLLITRLLKVCDCDSRKENAK